MNVYIRVHIPCADDVMLLVKSLFHVQEPMACIACEHNINTNASMHTTDSQTVVGEWYAARQVRNAGWFSLSFLSVNVRGDISCLHYGTASVVRCRFPQH